MSQVAPPGGYTERQQQVFRAGPPRRRVRRSRSDRLVELLRAVGIRGAALGASVLVETILLLIALVPQTVWASLGYPGGPIPTALAPLVAGAFYVLPALSGALCRRWQVALVLATFPAWVDLGVFAIAAASQIGPFYLVADPHTTNTLNTLELFAVLGALGWLARTSLSNALAWRKGSRR